MEIFINAPRIPLIFGGSRLLMRYLREMNIPAHAQVRRAPAEYNAARQQVQEVNRNEPDEAEPGEIREGFERLAKETARAGPKARDKTLQRPGSAAVATI